MKGKQVRFMDVEFIAPTCFVGDEFDSSVTWYTRDELSRVRKKARRDVSLFKRALLTQEYPSESMYCIRGLEHHLNKDAHKIKRKRVKSAIYGVLDAQDEIRMQFGEDSASIKNNYILMTRWARHEAMMIGEEYAVFAISYLKSGSSTDSDTVSEESMTSSEGTASTSSLNSELFGIRETIPPLLVSW
eukprot:CAMPEP_0195292836 /NCGR_PEP_ID=MMETSP0707-20130614/11001_1 /TAXON_ID=33640 /ORGANISM="Asterionellopsis glacialis, Strain CCMP134" /LENGTH=187 /DNA_ID=CAMNT_0040353413 /DNA_START=179 /DNA_END=742 /DNA_ORIENTATION=+